MAVIGRSVGSDAIPQSTVQLVISVTLTYACLGWVGLAFANSPGAISPVFPASGLALGCVLWFGPSALPGVWLGSALLKLSHAGWCGTLTATIAVVAALIATGATLQAWVGSWLVRRSLGLTWRTLEREQDVLVFLLLGGAVAGAVSPVVGVSTLQSFGIIDRVGFRFDLWTWYLGDLLGVLVFAPLTLCLLNRKGELWRDRRRRIVMPMLLTLSMVALVFYGAARWERQDQDRLLELDSQTIVKRIADRVISHREVLSSLKHFVEAMPDFGFNQFETFTRNTLDANPDIFALSFNDMIVDEERLEYESLMSRISPLGSFQITERDATGTLIRARTRPEYVAVRYIVPVADNRPAVGYDIYSEPVRREAIDRARVSGAMAVTAPIRLVQEQMQRIGVLELLPVAGEPRLPPQEPESRLLGFAVAVVKIDEMVAIATQGHVPAGLIFRLVDPQAQGGLSLLYSSGIPGADEIAPDRTASPWKGALRMGDRDWELTVYPTEDYWRRHRPWMAWGVGVAGLLFASLLQILMLGMTGRTSMQKRDKEKLAHSHDLMRYVIEYANSAVAVHDRELRYLFVSQSYLDQYQVKDREVIGRHHYEVFPDLPQKWRDVHQKVLSGAVLSAEDDPYEKADGTVEWTRWACRPWHEADGSIGGLIVYTEIITQRKQAEEALRASLEEKEILLKEVHHRVKNNLQVVSSLLNLQLRQVKNAEVQSFLRDTQNRIRSIAMLHEILYRSGNIASIRFPIYIKSLCDYLTRSYDSAARNIRLRQEIADVALDPDQSITAGLIVNELVTNAIKHAFPSGVGGDIFVELRAAGGDGLMLRVADSGIGFPVDSLPQDADSLGLLLVKILSQQLGGRLSVSGRPGASFEIVFPHGAGNGAAGD
jgi:PAS domain S-box-containing protein